jgi:hypothetical protein
MAKLIITRPGIGRFAHAAGSYPIRVNGQRVGAIGPGKSVEIELPPGRHPVRVGYILFGSQPVDIDAGPDETHRLAIGSNRRFANLFGLCAILALLPQLAFIYWFSARGPQRGLAASDGGWYGVIMLPVVVLPVLVQMAFLVALRTHSLYLLELTGLDLTQQQIADLLRAPPVRVRTTIRQLMIAVAILAILLAAAIGWTRRQRSDHFRFMASLHARLGQIVRNSEQSDLRFAANREASGLDTGGFRQAAAKAAARADYHEAMRRKYEQAAAQGWFSVEPDPPEPAWP